MQYGIITELRHEASPEGRLAILAAFTGQTLAKRDLPHWGVIHRPDAHNDPRSFHAHILYYARPGRRTADGWRFNVDTGHKAMENRGIPVGTEAEQTHAPHSKAFGGGQDERDPSPAQIRTEDR